MADIKNYLDVDTTVIFNEDDTIDIAFKNVPIDDVEYLFASLATEETQQSFISGLEAAIRDGD